MPPSTAIVTVTFNNIKVVLHSGRELHKRSGSIPDHGPFVGCSNCAAADGNVTFTVDLLGKFSSNSSRDDLQRAASGDNKYFDHVRNSHGFDCKFRHRSLQRFGWGHFYTKTPQNFTVITTASSSVNLQLLGTGLPAEAGNLTLVSGTGELRVLPIPASRSLRKTFWESKRESS